VADRIARGEADALLRNRQEERQRQAVRAALSAHGYREVGRQDELVAGSYVFSVTEKLGPDDTKGIQLDAVIRVDDTTPVFLELKSAGDEANTNKRRKEESAHAEALRGAHGQGALPAGAGRTLR